MRTQTELATLLALCAASYYRRDWLAMDTDEQRRRCQQLDRYGVLSVSALSSIFDLSSARVSQIAEQARGVRGTLNPKHISLLAYALSNHDVSPSTLRLMKDQGTSLNMITRLTQISKATLHRRLHD